MIIEQEEKIEIVEDNKTNENHETDFEQVTYEEDKKINYIFIAFGIFLLVILLLILICFGIFTFYNYKNKEKISKGIYINNIDVSGLTKDEAKKLLEKNYSDLLSNDITLVYPDYTTYIKTSEIELSYDIDSAINYAYEVGKNGNIFTNNIQTFSTLLNGINITPTYSFNKNSLKKILTNISSELPDAVVESGYYLENNNLIITKGSSGSVVDVDTTASSLENKLQDLNFITEIIELSTISKEPKAIDIDSIYSEVHKDAKDAYFTEEPHVVYPSENGLDFKISIEEAKQLVESSEKECTIPLKVVYPNITTNMIGQEAFPDLLASFSTKYAASNYNRTTNLRLAAEKIDGYVLLPDEVFSYNTVVGERTIAAGYKNAAIYSNGEVVDGLGGGICQISTTLYNAILFANLDTVELHNHQFVPSYVGAGRDATVVYGVKDFKFKNTRKYAIKITCSVSGGIAKFNIWGLREDPEYDINVFANVNSSTASYIKSSTYRTKALNGEIVKRENIINSTYKKH